MRPVWNELAYNLESFNPLFTAAVLKVQNTLGSSDYEARDTALAHLIQPLAGEYGLHHSIPLGNTHRQLFAEFYESVTGEQLSELLAQESPEDEPYRGVYAAVDEIMRTRDALEADGAQEARSKVRRGAHLKKNEVCA